MSLTLQKRIDAFARLGSLFASPDAELLQAAELARQRNGWFTQESVLRTFSALAFMLESSGLSAWLSAYDIADHHTPKTVGLVLAGNIPLVGFHDVLCVLLSGNRAQIKLSSDDAVLMPLVLKKLTGFERGFADLFQFTERLAGFDAVIATGSNNTSRYFEYYFGRYPHVIRKNRTSVAVITGEEKTEEISALGHDIFDYFGLGCRNVSKIFVPKEYTFDRLFEPLESFQPVINQHKYNNNYDYQKSIYLVNRVEHFDNGFLLLKEDNALATPLAVLYYQRYHDITEAETIIRARQEEIQCVVSGAALRIPVQLVGFGESQKPGPADYADGVDTLRFLTGL